jgi:hypothetical protein
MQKRERETKIVSMHAFRMRREISSQAIPVSWYLLEQKVEAEKEIEATQALMKTYEEPNSHIARFAARRFGKGARLAQRVRGLPGLRERAVSCENAMDSLSQGYTVEAEGILLGDIEKEYLTFLTSRSKGAKAYTESQNKAGRLISLLAILNPQTAAELRRNFLKA